MPGVREPVMAMIPGNKPKGTEGMNEETVNGFGSDPSRPPTPHGSGLPDNFGEVALGIYRSSYPQPAHLNSILGLKLKTIVTLVKEPLSAAYVEAMKQNGITYHLIPILPNKTPGVSTPQETIDKVLKILLNPQNHPVLIHCNKGKHRTGCVMACFRRLQGWAADNAVAEYLHYAEPKARPLDQLYIREYDSTTLAHVAEEARVSNWASKAPNEGGLNIISMSGNSNPVTTSQDDAVRPIPSLLNQKENFHIGSACNGKASF